MKRALTLAFAAAVLGLVSFMPVNKAEAGVGIYIGPGGGYGYGGYGYRGYRGYGYGYPYRYRPSPYAYYPYWRAPRYYGYNRNYYRPYKYKRRYWD